MKLISTVVTITFIFWLQCITTPLQAFAGNIVSLPSGSTTVSTDNNDYWRLNKLYFPESGKTVYGPNGSTIRRVKITTTLEDYDLPSYRDSAIHIGFRFDLYDLNGSVVNSESVSWMPYNGSSYPELDYTRIVDLSLDYDCTRIDIIPFYDYSDSDSYSVNSTAATFNFEFWTGVYHPSESEFVALKNTASTASTNSTNAYNASIAAKNSAIAAKSSADAAHMDAQNASNHTYYNSNTSGYWSYYSYSKANSANLNAASAKNMLNGLSNGGKSLAATYDKANSAITAANNAKASSDVAVNELQSSNHGLSRIKSDTSATLTKVTTVVDQTTYNGQSSAYWAYVASVNAGADTIAPSITDIKGEDGATCTTGTSFTVVITASDNGSDNNLRYRAICDGFDSGWVSGNSITITGLSSGAKTATIKVSDNPTSPDSGNISQDSFTFFKI